MLQSAACQNLNHANFRGRTWRDDSLKTCECPPTTEGPRPGCARAGGLTQSQVDSLSDVARVLKASCAKYPKPSPQTNTHAEELQSRTSSPLARRDHEEDVRQAGQRPTALAVRATSRQATRTSGWIPFLVRAVPTSASHVIFAICLNQRPEHHARERERGQRRKRRTLRRNETEPSTCA